MRRRFGRIAGRTIGGVAAGVVALVVGSATARAEENEFNREGAYAGLNGIFALDESVGSLDVSDGGGLSVVGGYRMVPELGFELEGGWIDVGDTNVGEIQVNLKIYPLEFFDLDLGTFARIQPFGMGSAGVAFGDVDGDNNVGGRFGGGGGIEAYVTENIAVHFTGQYVGTSGGISDLRFGRFTLGGIYRW